MFFKFPKNDKNFQWTRHIKDKMLFYRISEQKIKSIIKSPDRKEEGIALNTVAVMKRNDKPLWQAQGKQGKLKQEEIWAMYQRKSKFNPSADGQNLKSQEKNQKFSGQLIMISAWRYPGCSKPGKAIPIPEDILTELGLG